ncbi:MAG: hypothetical protein ACRD2C_05320 [Acidimicrobiales bacterium]
MSGSTTSTLPNTRPTVPATTYAMVAAPLLLFVVSLISPINDSDEPAERLADVFAHEARYAVAALCLLAGMMLLVPAVLGLRHSLPAAGHRPATVGAVVSSAGFMLFTAATGALGLAPGAWATLPAAEQAVLLPAFTAMDEGKGPLGLVLGGPLLPVVGLTILAVVLWRRTDLLRPAVVALPVGWAVFLFAPVNPVRAIGAVLLAFGFGMAALANRPSAATSPASS